LIAPSEFTQTLEDAGFAFFTGVPDSLLKELCACITDSMGSERHVIAANEGAAVGLAAGYHLATGRAAVVYMQNSGTGNAINPLLSLADPEVYSIPMLLVIGWRGEPGVKDEPQHVKQGRVQEALLESLEYPYEILSQDPSEAREQVARLSAAMRERSTPVALLVRKGTFSEYEGQASRAQAAAGGSAAGAAGGEPAPAAAGCGPGAGARARGGSGAVSNAAGVERGADDTGAVTGHRGGSRAAAEAERGGSGAAAPAEREAGQPAMTREAALERILPAIGGEARIVSTTGKTSREIYELREARGEGHAKDFLTVGSMGHAISIALGVAKFCPERPVYCVDGDGAAIMHMGSVAVAGAESPPNLRHIVINNGAHESVGGQPTAGSSLSFAALALELGYRDAWTAATPDELERALEEMSRRTGPSLLEVRVEPGSRSDLGRPRTTPVENKRAFIREIGEGQGA